MNLKHLKSRREQLGFSQAEVAQAAGVDKGTYFRIEKNGAETTVTVFELIAKKLDCSTDYLLGLVNDPNGQYPGQRPTTDENLLLIKVRAGEAAEAAASAVDLAQRYHETNISGMKPATDG